MVKVPKTQLPRIMGQVNGIDILRIRIIYLLKYAFFCHKSVPVVGGP